MQDYKTGKELELPVTMEVVDQAMALSADARGRGVRIWRTGLVGDVAKFFWYVDPAGPCWYWTGALSVGDGYGRCRFNGTTLKPHRVVWEILVGPIPNGYHIDHLCKNKLCVNPDHLEPVTPGENVRRGSLALENSRRGHQRKRGRIARKRN